MVLVDPRRDGPDAGVQIPVFGSVGIEIRKLVEGCRLGLSWRTLDIENLCDFEAGELGKRHDRLLSQRMLAKMRGSRPDTVRRVRARSAWNDVVC